MNNDLPNVFPGDISEDINNTQEIYYSKGNERLKKDEDLSIESKINRIFNSPNYIYKKDVWITKEGKREKLTIIGKTNNNLLTIDNKMIAISTIDDIEII